MKNPLPYQRMDNKRLSLWHSLLLLLTTFLFPMLAFATAPNILIEQNAIDFGAVAKGGSSTRIATVLNYNPMPATVTTGTWFSCAVESSGGVKCWGNGANGKLGNGAITDSKIPVAVTGINNAVQVSAGNLHACALLNDGSVKCWGYNAQGQLGDGTTIQRTSPVAVSGVTNATAISSGENYSCALISDGSITCWGQNTYGKLGDGTTSNSSTPIKVTGITKAIAISAGGDYACAITTDTDRYRRSKMLGL